MEAAATAEAAAAVVVVVEGVRGVDEEEKER